jgi:hypothetical protein
VGTTVEPLRFHSRECFSMCHRGPMRHHVATEVVIDMTWDPSFHVAKTVQSRAAAIGNVRLHFLRKLKQALLGREGLMGRRGFIMRSLPELCAAFLSSLSAATAAAAEAQLPLEGSLAVQVYFCGAVKVGKSSLENATSSETVFPAAGVHCTSRITRAYFGSPRQCQLRRSIGEALLNYDGAPSVVVCDATMDEDAEAEYPVIPLPSRDDCTPIEMVSLRGDERAAENLFRMVVNVQTPNPLLSLYGIEILDCPGLTENAGLRDHVLDTIRQAYAPLVVYVIDKNKQVERAVSRRPQYHLVCISDCELRWCGVICRMRRR